MKKTSTAGWPTTFEDSADFSYWRVCQGDAASEGQRRDLSGSNMSAAT